MEVNGEGLRKLIMVNFVKMVKKGGWREKKSVKNDEWIKGAVKQGRGEWSRVNNDEKRLKGGVKQGRGEWSAEGIMMKRD